MNNIDKKMKYVIFPTQWGCFGLSGTDSVLYQAKLPATNPKMIETYFSNDFPQAKFDKNLFKNLQTQIIDYFKGNNADFNTNIPVFLDNFSDFTRLILTSCRLIKPGQTLTYSELAQKAGYPKASRAVGNVLAKNPIPLIIPCHRVIRSDGKIGGFSAFGGPDLKKRLLFHEKNL